MPSISTIPSRSTPFTGDPALVQPVIINQVFHATDTGIPYVANSLTLGDLTAYGGIPSGGGGGGSATVPGYFVCSINSPYYRYQTLNATTQVFHRLSGKAIRLLEYKTHTLNIKVTDEFAAKLPTPTEVTNNGLDANKLIEVHRWSELPNDSATGREWVADLPREGGEVEVEIDSSYKWFSVMARNYDSNNSFSYPNSNSQAFDGVYLQWHNTSDVWLWTFTDNLDLSFEIDNNSYDAGFS